MVEDKDVDPNHTNAYASGLYFRNNYFKLPIQADFLLVCGGAKNSIGLKESRQFFDEKDQAKFKFIIEASDDYFTLSA